METWLDLPNISKPRSEIANTTEKSNHQKNTKPANVQNPINNKSNDEIKYISSQSDLTFTE